MPSNRLIFIVEDDDVYAGILTDHLSSDPRNTVMCFGDGDDCLKNIYNNPDIVILDYHLSLKKGADDGLQILQKIKKESPNTKVVMLSGQEHYGLALQTISKGAEHYVVKDKDAFGNLDHIIQSLS